MALGFANERSNRKAGVVKRDAVAWAIDEVSEELGGRLGGKVSGSSVESRRVDCQPRSKRNEPLSDTVGLAHGTYLDEVGRGGVRVERGVGSRVVLVGGGKEKCGEVWWTLLCVGRWIWMVGIGIGIGRGDVVL